MMESVDKEKLEQIKKFFIENPDVAKQFIKNNPDLLKWLNNTVNSSDNISNSNNLSSNQNGNSFSGKKLVKSMPGSKVPRMFDWDNNGFSNYLLLAVLAFTIQFIITLVCICFYK